MFPLFIRSLKFLIGGAFVFVLGLALFGTVKTMITEPEAETAEHAMHKHPKKLDLPSDGILGKFDNAQLQRGFQVYKEVCAVCHSLNMVSFRELHQLGYTEAEVKKIAKDWGTKHPLFDEKGGTWGERDNLPSDRIPKVYYAGTGSPPDLSLMAKARHDGGAYLYSLLTGYGEKPSAEALKHFPEFAKPPEGMFFNPYFANLNLSMPPPLTGEGQVAYADGTRATVDQMAKDVSAFLVWTAEPHAQTRKMAGFAVIGFLLFATILAYGAYLTVWKGVKH
ncbi:MAG: cytochrome c1 [Sphingomonadales bacterium]|nr:MAG: cytochrome c1 [Sphingomonadales bacterium]